jgi:hypothetical protein
MKAKISTIIATNEKKMWEELQKTCSLLYVASPILIFKPRQGKELPEKWEIDKPYQLRIHAFGFVPLGKHDIVVKIIDSHKKEIFTNESGAFAKTWNHFIRIEKRDESTIRYSDEIEIKAGILTVFIWLFAHAFYRHRQRKWKRWLECASRAEDLE